MKTKKAQIIATDLFLAVVVYIIIIIVVTYIYSSYMHRLDNEVRYRDMTSKAFEISDNILKHMGYPTGWNTTSVKVIGLAESDRVLSTEKLTNFANMSYNYSKRVLGISTYEYFIQIRDFYNRNLLETGASPIEDSICNSTYEAVTLRRFALWEGQRVIVYITLWDDKCQRSIGHGSIMFGQQMTYRGYPEEAFEEDNSPSWSTQLWQEGDYQYAAAYDESLAMPDYVHFNFPNLMISSAARIQNVSLKIVHREDPAGGYFPTNQSYRKMIRCWNGAWTDLGAYEISSSPTEWATYYNADISGCINSVELANNIHIIMNYDPAFDTGGTQDIDFAEVVVKTG
ncbi:MAG: hypothetical protein V1906_02475 [Candidatus Woesearchaeota archaeon]